MPPSDSECCSQTINTIQQISSHHFCFVLFTVARYCIGALNSPALDYLSQLLIEHTAAQSLIISSESAACSACETEDQVDKAFQSVAPRLWSSLPITLS